MTLREVAIKNIRHNKSIYSAFFLASALSIYMFFLLLSLVMNKEFVGAVLSGTVTGIFSAVLLVIGIFSMVFIPYCYRSLIIARSKDYGLYKLMGISKKHLRKIVVTESIFFSGISLIIGLGLGALSSYYYYLIALKITGISIEQAPFNLNFLIFIYTGALFVVIFIIATLITIVDLNRRELIYFIKLAKRKRTGNEKGIILGTIGFLTVIFSILLSGYVMFISRGSYSGYIYTFSIITCLIGFYLALGNYGFVVMKICKGIRAYYLKNLLQLSQISYRFSDYKFVIFTVSMLSALVVFFSSFIVGLLLGEETHLTTNIPYDLEINYRDDININNEFDKIIKRNRDKISYSFKYEKLHIDNIVKNGEQIGKMKFVNSTAASVFLGEELIVGDGITVFLKNSRPNSWSKKWIWKGDIITLESGFKLVSDHMVSKPFSAFGPSLFIVSDNDYRYLRNSSDRISSHKMINFHNPQDGLDIFHKLFKKYRKMNQFRSQNFFLVMKFSPESITGF